METWITSFISRDRKTSVSTIPPESTMIEYCTLTKGECGGNSLRIRTQLEGALSPLTTCEDRGTELSPARVSVPVVRPRDIAKPGATWIVAGARATAALNSSCWGADGAHTCRPLILT